MGSWRLREGIYVVKFFLSYSFPQHPLLSKAKNSPEQPHIFFITRFCFCICFLFFFFSYTSVIRFYRSYVLPIHVLHPSRTTPLIVFTNPNNVSLNILYETEMNTEVMRICSMYPQLYLYHMYHSLTFLLLTCTSLISCFYFSSVFISTSVSVSLFFLLLLNSSCFYYFSTVFLSLPPFSFRFFHHILHSSLLTIPLFFSLSPFSFHFLSSYILL